MEKIIKPQINGKNVQLADWVVMEYSATLVKSPDDEIDTGIAIWTDVTKEDEGFYLLDMDLDAQPPQDGPQVFKYHCHVQAKFLTIDTFTGTDYDARVQISTDGLNELYTLTKGFLATNTGNSDVDPVILPSISVTVFNEE